MSVEIDSSPVRAVAEGDLTKKVKISAVKFSAAARAKIEKAGATITEIAVPDPAAKWKEKRGTVKKEKAAAKAAKANAKAKK